MRKKFILSLILVSFLPMSANNAVSKSHFSPRSWFQAASPERLSFVRERMDRRDEGMGTSFEVTGYSSKSSDSDGLAQYFLPNGKSTLVAGELGSTAYKNRTNDIVSNYFNLATKNYSTTANFASMTFQSTLTFKPSQKVTGIGLQLQQRLPKKFWLSVSAPITKVENTLGMTEEITTAGGGGPVPTGGVSTMVDAFKHASMTYGKIDGTRSKWGVADVEILIGRDSVQKKNSWFGGYVGAVVPTGDKPDPAYMFNAYVGNGKHVGAMIGTYGKYLWKEGSDYALVAFYDVNSRFLFSNTQKRTLDYKNKPWGRHIWLVKDGTSIVALGSGNFEDTLEYGVNVLTQDVRVKPYGSFTLNSGLDYRHSCGFEVEVGTNFYARRAEEVTLVNSFTNSDSYGIPDITDLVTAGTHDDTYSLSTINQIVAQKDLTSNVHPYTGATSFQAITEADLDLNSAAHPAVVESTIYGAAGWNWDDWKYPGFLKAGGSFTFYNNNSSMERWAVWGKVGLSF